MNKNLGTFGNRKFPELTIEDIKKASDYVFENKADIIKNKGIEKWFARLMNKFGWHRNYKIIFFDKSKLNFWGKYLLGDKNDPKR